MAEKHNSTPAKENGSGTGPEPYQILNFSDLEKRPICAGSVSKRVGKLTDLVFRKAEPYPEVVGLYIEHGWGEPTEFIPWEKVIKIADDAIFVQPAESGGQFAPFVDQPGWILVGQHLVGRTILDMDGRRTEVVNDVQFLASRGRMLLVHVDVSFNGFWRRWGLSRFVFSKDRLIGWKYVQPLSLEDAGTTDSVQLSITHKQIAELPGEDLADALEMLSGKEQEAVFSALDAEKAAEVLQEAEPRAQRQLVAGLRRERAAKILTEMSVPQIADLFSVLPHDDVAEMMPLLPPEDRVRIEAILSDREASATALMSNEYLVVAKTAKVAEVLERIRRSGMPRNAVSYVYVLVADKFLAGVLDLRDLVLAADDAVVAELMAAPVVAAEQDDTREDLAELFAKYHYRMLPVVDSHDEMLGVIRYKDIMKGLVTRART